MKQETILYASMTTEQQTQWVTAFASQLETLAPWLATLGSRSASAVGSRPSAAPPAVSTAGVTPSPAAVKSLFALLSAWPFAQDFCAKAMRYGDYMARAARLPIYIDKVKERLSDGLTMTDARGRTVAYVSPSAPMRRRGRPTKAEAAARMAGHQVTLPAEGPENEKRRRIAALLGLEVVVAGEAPREKNNAELALERAAKKAAYDRQNPPLFPEQSGNSSEFRVQSSELLQRPAANGRPAASDRPAPTSAASPSQPSGPAGCRVPSGSAAGTSAAATVPDAAASGTPAASSDPLPPNLGGVSMLMSDVYADRIAQDRFHLTDLAWLCSDDLRPRIEQVRELRMTAEAASERAKLLAEQGAAPEVIAPEAERAQAAVDEYTAIYAAVDTELAILFKRLEIDLPFIERFKLRFQRVEIEKVLKITRPYYEKMKCPELDVRIKTLIEQDNPEYAARLAQEEKDKAEVADIVRYIKRTDKGPSAARVKTMTDRIARLRELRGDDFADAFLPILEQTKAALAEKQAAKAAASSEFRGQSSELGCASPAPSDSATVPAPSDSATVPDAAASGKKKSGKSQTTKRPTTKTTKKQ